MLNEPSALQLEIAQTELALEDARTDLDITISAARANLRNDAPAPKLLDRYTRELKEVVRLERYGWELEPNNPLFQPQGVLK